MITQKKITEYKIIKEYSLCIQYFSGLIEKKDIVDFVTRMNADKDYNSSYNTIIDVRNTDLVWNEGEIKEYASFVGNLDDFAGSRKIAVLTANADQLITAFFSKEYSETLPMEFKIISTVDAALFYLDLMHFSEEEYDQIVSEIVNSN